MNQPPPPPTAEQSLQDLAYAVSHDLGASARAIRGFSDLLAKRYSDVLDGEAQTFLRLLTKGACELQGQIDGLVRYSRVITHAKLSVPTDLSKIWSDLVQEAAPRIQQIGAKTERNELPTVIGDAEQLLEVLAELLENSIKFRGEVPLVIRFTAESVDSISTSTNGPRWLFRWTDNGRGIAAQHRDRVLKMFQRLCPEIPGIGAGLPICQRIINRHGGSLWIESDTAAGTSVCFTLPN